MNWIKHKLANWAYDSLYSLKETTAPVQTTMSVEVDGLSFNVMAAEGGTIIQIRSYDRKTDRSRVATHVVPDGEDISTAIGHIVSLELLRS